VTVREKQAWAWNE